MIAISASYQTIIKPMSNVRSSLTQARFDSLLNSKA